MTALTIKVKQGVPQRMDVTDHSSFDEWMAKVISVMLRGAGIHPFDLEDMPWHTWYDSRLRPIRAANRALRRTQSE